MLHATNILSILAHLHSITNTDHRPACRGRIGRASCSSSMSNAWHQSNLQKAPFHVCYIQKILQQRPNSLHDSYIVVRFLSFLAQYLLGETLLFKKQIYIVDHVFIHFHIILWILRGLAATYNID